jgi:hypothetical protein
VGDAQVGTTGGLPAWGGRGNSRPLKHFEGYSAPRKVSCRGRGARLDGWLRPRFDGVLNVFSLILLFFSILRFYSLVFYSFLFFVPFFPFFLLFGPDCPEGCGPKPLPAQNRMPATCSDIFLASS